jgi:hypothetical protein
VSELAESVATPSKRARPPGREQLLARLPDLRSAPDELSFSRRELAALLDTTPGKLKRMEDEGRGPPCFYLGERLPRYQLGGVRAWLKTVEAA